MSESGWKEIDRIDCESGFYDVEIDNVPQSELTVPNKMNLHWLDGNDTPGILHRPEMDAKDAEKGHPEVYEGQFSATGFVINSTGRFGLVSNPIPIEEWKPVRASVKYMHVFNTSGNDPQGGCRLGLIFGYGPFAPGSGPKWFIDPFQDTHPDIVWGEWRSAADLANRKWATLTTPERAGESTFILLVTQFNSDYAVDFSGAHWDNWIVEQYTEEIEPPNPSDLGDQIRDLAAELESIQSDLLRIASDVDDQTGSASAREDVLAAQENLNSALSKM